MKKLTAIERFISLACKSEASKEAYRSKIKLFCNIFNTTLEDILKEWFKVKYELVKREQFLDKWINNLDDYKVYLRNKGYSELTINQMLAIAKSFFKWNRIPIGIIQYERPIVRYHNRDIKAEEIRTILEHSNLRDRAFYLLMKDSGLRPHTICKLKYKNIKEDFEANRIPMIIKTPAKILKIRGDIGRANERFSLIGEEAFNTLKEYLKTRGSLKDEDYVFIRIKKNKPTPIHRSLPSWNFCRTVKTLKLCEIKENKGKKELRLYCLRKYFRNNMRCDSHYVQFWMAHKIDQSDEHYISKDYERHREEYKKGYDSLRIYGNGVMSTSLMNTTFKELEEKLRKEITEQIKKNLAEQIEKYGYKAIEDSKPSETTPKRLFEE